MTTQEMRDLLWGTRRNPDPLTPEYWGAKGCPVDLRVLPFVCYNGEVEGVVVDADAYPDGVFAPSARIVHRFDGMPDFLDTSSVVYDTAKECFLLCVDGKYYNKWGSDKNIVSTAPWYDASGIPDETDIFVRGAANSLEWNTEDGKARGDRLFHDLQTKVTYVRNAKGMKDIRTLMPNDYSAIMKCLKANGGSMRLTKGKLYYCELPKQNTTAFRNYDGFDIDGQGACIWLARADKGVVPTDKGGTANWTWLPMKNCGNGYIHNLELFSLPEVDSGAPSGHWAFASNSSGLAAFQLNEGCHNITFDSISSDGINGPVTFRYGRGFVVRDCEFRGMSQISASMVDTRFLRCVFEQDPFVGDGTHIVYGMGGMSGILFDHCTFRTTSPFTSVMLTYHGSVSGKLPKGVVYLDCTMEGTRIFQGSALAKGEQTQIFADCVLKQTYSTYLYTSGDNNAWGVSSALGIGSGTNLIFERCFITTASKLVTYDGRKEPLLSITECNITGGDCLDDLVGGFKGTLIADRNVFTP